MAANEASSLQSSPAYLRAGADVSSARRAWTDGKARVILIPAKEGGYCIHITRASRATGGGCGLISDLANGIDMVSASDDDGETYSEPWGSKEDTALAVRIRSQDIRRTVK